MNLTLEELSLKDDGTGKEDGKDISFGGFLTLKNMPRLKILNLYHKTNNCVEIHRLRHHLPHMKISGAPLVYLPPQLDYNDKNDSSDWRYVT